MRRCLEVLTLLAFCAIVTRDPGPVLDLEQPVRLGGLTLGMTQAQVQARRGTPRSRFRNYWAYDGATAGFWKGVDRVVYLTGSPLTQDGEALLAVGSPLRDPPFGSPTQRVAHRGMSLGSRVVSRVAFLYDLGSHGQLIVWGKDYLGGRSYYVSGLQLERPGVQVRLDEYGGEE